MRVGAASDVVVCAAGGLPGELHKLWQAGAPLGYHVEYGYSCMGYEIAGGIGVKMALPDREVIVVVGDGSYLMMNSEIATSVMLGCKLIIVVNDNRGFGCINRLQMATGGEPFNNLLARRASRGPARGRFRRPCPRAGRASREGRLRSPSWRRAFNAGARGDVDAGHRHRHRSRSAPPTPAASGGTSPCPRSRSAPQVGAARATSTRKRWRPSAWETEMTIRIGANPIGWSNDDLQEIGGDTPLETCLAEAKQAGVEGMEKGHKLPNDGAALKAKLAEFGLVFVGGWYSTRIAAAAPRARSSRTRRPISR